MTDVDNRIGGISLRIGKQWNSFEQLRTEGPFGIKQAIRQGTIGLLRLGTAEYVVLNRRDFDRLHGLAAEIRRLSNGVVLIKQAVELAMKSPDRETSLSHVYSLAMEFTLPTTTTAWNGQIELDTDASGSPGGELDPKTFRPRRALTEKQGLGSK